MGRYLLSRVVCLSVCLCPCVYTFHFITVCPCNFYFHEYIKKKKKKGLNFMSLARSQFISEFYCVKQKYNKYDCILHKNNETSDKFYRKVAFPMYTKMVHFRPQSLKVASKQKSHRRLDTRLISW